MHVIERFCNGVDTEQLYGTVDAIEAVPELGLFRFRAANRWIDGAHSRTTIRGFHGAGQEDNTRMSEFVLDAGEPAILLGADSGPSPAEHLLHALAACLTTSLVYAAAERRIRLTEVESRAEGDIDVRGALGVPHDVRTGFTSIRIALTVKGDAPEETLRELVACARRRSAVYDVVAHGVPVAVDVHRG